MHTRHFVRMLEPGIRQVHAREDLTPGTRLRRSVAYSDSLWENASTVTFSFKDGTPEDLRVRIEFCIRQWEPYISLALELVDDGGGQIRIAVEGNDSYSAIGTWALQEDPDEPTLVIGKATDDPFSSKHCCMNSAMRWDFIMRTFIPTPTSRGTKPPPMISSKRTMAGTRLRLITTSSTLTPGSRNSSAPTIDTPSCITRRPTF